MSHPQNQEENTIVPHEESETGRQFQTNSEQAPIHVHNVANLNVILHHQQIRQQLIQQDNRPNLTVINNQPKRSDVPFGDEKGLKKEIENLQKTIRKLYHPKYDVDLTTFDVFPEDFPAVYSEMFQVDFYQGMFIPNEDKYNPKTPGIKLTTFDRAVTIDQLVSDIKKNSFISVIGFPGVGKTTLSKRIARFLSNDKNSLVLRKLFMNMNSCEDKRSTLEEFLLGDCNYNLNKKERNVVFEWMKANPENCFIILDGFDQVSWNLEENLKESNYNTLLQDWETLSNLCLGKFLQKCHLIFTSRPHAMLKIPQKCRPKRTYFIRDLTPENMKALFDALINNHQQSEIIWNDLSVKTPHLKSMCHNPLMLQLYLRASFCSSHKIADISTLTRIFHTVLLNLKASGHAISLSDTIVIRLSKLAYEATKKETVLITAEDLQIENLSSEKVQDLVVTLFGANKEYALLEGKRQLYFSHQTFQEYFTALYICREMPLEDFTSFVQNNLLSDQWSVVFQFLSGLLVDQYMNKASSISAISQQSSNESTSTLMPTSSQQNTSSQPLLSRQFTPDSILPRSSVQQPPLFQKEKLQKKQIFISELHKKSREVAAGHNGPIILISKILRETNNDEVIKTAGSCYKGGWIWIYPFDTQNDIRAVASFLKLMPSQIGMLFLSGYSMTSNEFLPWIEAIKSMPGSIVELDINGNSLSNVADVIAILHKVEELVSMQNCLDDGLGAQRCPNMEERARLQVALDRTQNKNLKLLVDYEPPLTHKDAAKES